MIVVKKFSTVMGFEAPLANRRNDRFAQRGEQNMRRGSFSARRIIRRRLAGRNYPSAGARMSALEPPAELYFAPAAVGQRGLGAGWAEQGLQL